MSLSLRYKHVPSGVVSNSSKSEGQTKEKAASSRLVDETKVHGFETELISLEKMLDQRQSSDQFKAIGIVGKRGVGKTTLCQVLFKKKEPVGPVQANFLPRIWVCMSWKPNEYRDDFKATVVRRMLTYLGIENDIIDSVYKDHSLSGLLYALHLQLTGKKYLIVLDDVKETGEWFANLDSPITEKEKWGERLAFGLPKGHGGTIIVTSRDEKVAKMMVGEKNLLHLLPLSHPKSCSSIFNDHINEGPKLENDTECKEFLKKCAGLPLAATMMGKIKSEELAAEKAAKEAAEKAAKEAAEKAAKEAAEKAAKEAAEKAAKEATEKAAKEPESPISSKDEEKNKIEELPTESKPIQPDDAAKNSKDDKKIKSVEVPAGEEPIQQQEKDARSSSKDDEQIKSKEHPAEAEPRPHQEGAAH
ncbi:hypothetical protein ACB092_10G050600 [Castanea dentata]